MDNDEYNNTIVPGQFSEVTETEPEHIGSSRPKRIGLIVLGVALLSYGVLAGTQNSLIPFRTSTNSSDAALESSLPTLPPEGTSQRSSTPTSRYENGLFAFDYAAPLRIVSDDASQLVLADTNDQNFATQSITVRIAQVGENPEIAIEQQNIELVYTTDIDILDQTITLREYSSRYCCLSNYAADHHNTRIWVYPLCPRCNDT